VLNVTELQTLSCSVKVMPPASIFIEPGVVIYSDQPSFRFDVRKGARLVALGLPHRPIVFDGPPPRASDGSVDYGNVGLQYLNESLLVPPGRDHVLYNVKTHPARGAAQLVVAGVRVTECEACSLPA